MARTISRKSYKGKFVKGRKMQIRGRKTAKKTAIKRRQRTIIRKRRTMKAVCIKSLLSELSCESLSTFRSFAKQLSMERELMSRQDSTLFVPSNDAFNAVPKEMMDKLLANPNWMKKVLLNHVIPKRIMSSEIPEGGEVTIATLAGPEITVTKKGGVIYIGNIRVIKSDVIGTNGVAHYIDNVMTYWSSEFMN